MNNTNNTVRCLNNAFQADPNAILSLMINRIPCNEALANDKFVQVDIPETLNGDYLTVGCLGLINGILAANNLPLVALMFSEPIEGKRKVIGFCEYK